jgi:dTDP-4-dehydrorhamnose reductase
MESKANLLITGVSGLLGGNLVRHLVEEYEVTGVYHKNEPSIPGLKLIQKDLSTEGAFEEDAFGDYSPDFIIHCAGEANVDTCELDPDRAERHIFRMTKLVSQFARKHDAYLVSLSTDAVSDGSREYLKESDDLNPINVYGKAKVRAEQYLASEHESSMIVRTRFYGINVVKDASFTEHLLKEFAQNHEVVCFTDNFCTQIYVMNLAEILAECMQKKLSGIFNIVEDEKFSRYDYARLVAGVFGFDENLIVPGSMSDVKTLAPRPPDTSLSNTKIKECIETEILPAVDGLAQMKRDLQRWH